MDGAVIVDVVAVREESVGSGNDGFGGVFAGETGAGDAVAWVKDYGGDFVFADGFVSLLGTSWGGSDGGGGKVKKYLRRIRSAAVVLTSWRIERFMSDRMAQL